MDAEAEPFKEASRRRVRLFHLRVHRPYAAGARLVPERRHELHGDPGASMLRCHLKRGYPGPDLCERQTRNPDHCTTHVERGEELIR